MPYSLRQQQCLRAMGLVPWVLRENASTATPCSQAAAGSSPHGSIHWPGKHWLLGNRGESELSVVGKVAASLIVIVDGNQPGAWLETDEEQLLDLMLRSIGVTRAEVLQCQASEPSELSPSISPEAACDEDGSAFTLGSLLGNEVGNGAKAALYLARFCPMINEVHAARAPYDPGVGIPLWGIPHPATLLHEPQRKREAWEVLKRLAVDLGKLPAAT